MGNISVKFGGFAAVLAAVLILSGCTVPDVSQDIFDPYEESNRRIHEGNKSLDRALVRPVADGYGTILPEPVRIGVGNFASNLSQPSHVLNDLMQFNIEDAVHNTVRFVINTTVGIGGLFDPAAAAGVEERDTDFGETLHVWGAPEGAYMELAIIGPSTERDAIGIAVDFFLDPLGQVLPEPEKYIAPLATGAAKVGDRYRFGDTVDSVLYDSADSYAQSRLIYLENRRFELGQSPGETEDLYEGLYDDFLIE